MIVLRSEADNITLLSCDLERMAISDARAAPIVVPSQTALDFPRHSRLSSKKCCF
jgi:hypothetical protein